jgi:hypothetical protein
LFTSFLKTGFQAISRMIETRMMTSEKGIKLKLETQRERKEKKTHKKGGERERDIETDIETDRQTDNHKEKCDLRTSINVT